MKNHRLLWHWRVSLILLLTVSVFTGCGTSKKVIQSAVSASRSIEILAVNDMYGAIDNFPRLAFIVDSLRSLYPNMLLALAGDNQTGNPVKDQYPEKDFL